MPAIGQTVTGVRRGPAIFRGPAGGTARMTAMRMAATTRGTTAATIFSTAMTRTATTEATSMTVTTLNPQPTLCCLGTFPAAITHAMVKATVV